MTSRFLIAMASAAACFLPLHPAAADPIHATTNGDYWHHDSNWIFPERIGEFVRVGIPQDIAGSSDAVAYYAWTRQDRRIVAAVHLFPKESAAEGTTLAGARAALGAPADQLMETEIPLGQRRATRVAITPSTSEQQVKTLYFVIAGDWRVLIEVAAPAGAGDLTASFDDFVRAQRWDTLP